VGLAALYVGAYVVCAAARVLYPYELNFCESALVAVVARVAAGLPIYAPPDVHFTSMVYTPLDFFVAWGVGHLHAGDYFGLRLTSVLATLWTGAVVGVVARRRGAPWWTVAAAVGTFFGASSRCAFVQDTAHVDALALAFTLSALALLFERPRSVGWALAAGALAGLGFLTKQTMIVFVAIPAGWLAIERRWGPALAYAGGALAVAAFLLLRWGLLDDPWFYFWVFKLESTIKVRLDKLLVYAPAYLAVCLPGGLVLGLLGGAADARGARDLVRRWWADPWAVVLLAFAGMALVAKAKDGGGENVFLPVFALGALQIGRHAHRLYAGGRRGVGALVALQLAVLFYPPTLPWPTRADVAAGDRLVAQIASFPGEVYVPTFPVYAVRAGKSWWVHYTVVCGLSQTDMRLRAELGELIRARRFAAILPRADIEPQDAHICDLPFLDEYYEVAGDVESPGNPSLEAILRGRPSVSALAHGNKLAHIYVPRPRPAP
jgi:hypothetical protein